MPEHPIFTSGYTITAKQCQKFVNYCKKALYAKSVLFNRVFSHEEAALAAREMEEYLNKEDRFTSHVHMNAHKTLHQMMRTWLHIHFPYQTHIVKHYLMKHHRLGVYANISTGTRAEEEISQKFLMGYIRNERENNSAISNSWDVKLTDLLVSHHAKTYYAALDHWLTSLGDDVVLIQWCADWYDELQFYKDEHGPLHAMLEPSSGEHARLPTYRLLHSRHVVSIGQKEYFTMAMTEKLNGLRDEDLANLIKFQWYSLTPELATLSHGIKFRGLTYNGIPVPHDYATQKARWMQQLESLFNLCSHKWQKENKDCAYDLMKAENTSDYHVDSGISLQTMMSELALAPVNIGNPLGVLLNPTFTTSQNTRNGKLSNQHKQRSSQQKKGRDYQAGRRGNSANPNHGENDSDSHARERRFLEELYNSRFDGDYDSEDDDHGRVWGGNNSENAPEDRGPGKALNMGNGSRAKRANLAKGLGVDPRNKYEAEKTKKPTTNDDRSSLVDRRWERASGARRGGGGGSDSQRDGGGGGDSLARPGAAGDIPLKKSKQAWKSRHGNEKDIRKMLKNADHRHRMSPEEVEEARDILNNTPITPYDSLDHQTRPDHSEYVEVPPAYRVPDGWWADVNDEDEMDFDEDEMDYDAEMLHIPTTEVPARNFRDKLDSVAEDTDEESDEETGEEPLPFQTFGRRKAYLSTKVDNSRHDDSRKEAEDNDREVGSDDSDNMMDDPYDSFARERAYFAEIQKQDSIDAIEEAQDNDRNYGMDGLYNRRHDRGLLGQARNRKDDQGLRAGALNMSHGSRDKRYDRGLLGRAQNGKDDRDGPGRALNMRNGLRANRDNMKSVPSTWVEENTAECTHNMGADKRRK